MIKFLLHSWLRPDGICTIYDGSQAPLLSTTEGSSYLSAFCSLHWLHYLDGVAATSRSSFVAAAADRFASCFLHSAAARVFRSKRSISKKVADLKAVFHQILKARQKALVIHGKRKMSGIGSYYGKNRFSHDCYGDIMLLLAVDPSFPEEIPHTNSSRQFTTPLNSISS